MKVYRLQLSKFSTKLTHLAEGSINSYGRWHWYCPVVYTTETTSLSILELLPYYLKISLIKAEYFLITIEIPGAVSSMEIDEKSLGKEWEHNQEITRKIGMDWFKSMRTCILKVPSVHSPNESNFIINSMHEDFEKIKIANVEIYNFDSRFH